MRYCFGDIVVVEHNKIGVIVKSWITDHKGQITKNYDVYVRTNDTIKNYNEDEIQRYMVRHKYLNKEEMNYQNNVINS